MSGEGMVAIGLAPAECAIVARIAQLVLLAVPLAWHSSRMLTFYERILLELLADGVSTTGMAWILRATDSELDLELAERLIELDLLILRLKVGATTTAGMLATSFRRGLIE